MAGTNPGGEGKGFKLVTILITSVVAPVTVYFLTHAIDTKMSVAPTQPIPAATATLQPTQEPSQPATATLQPTQAPAQPDAATLQPTQAPAQPDAVQPTATPTVSESSILPAAAPAVEPIEAESAPQEQETNPNGKGLQAGGFALTIEKQDVSLEGGALSLTIHVRNEAAKAQDFNYSAGAIRIKDSSGRVLEPLYGDKRGGCKKKDLDVKKKIRIEPGQEVTLRSAEAGKADQWCARDTKTQIPLYTTVEKGRIEAITVELNGLGPYRNKQVEIRLD